MQNKAEIVSSRKERCGDLVGGDGGRGGQWQKRSANVTGHRTLSRPTPVKIVRLLLIVCPNKSEPAANGPENCA